MILADTTFLIDSLRKEPGVKNFLLEHSNEILFTTEINIFELYLGLYSSKLLSKNSQQFEKRKNQLETLINKFQILSFQRGEALKAALLLGRLYRDGKQIEFRDGLIAGIAIANGLKKIVTRNEDHFGRIRELKVITY